MVILNHVFDLQVLKYNLIVSICKYPACFVQIVLPGVSNLAVDPCKDNLLLVAVARSLLLS